MVPLAFCHGCGGGGGGSGAGGEVAQVTVPTSAPVAVNRAPVIAVTGEAYAEVGVTYEYQPVANDPDGDTLAFTAANLPPWASISQTSGRITGTPGENDVGAYELITITVADAGRQTITDPFTITVVASSVAAAANSGVASLQWEAPPSKVDGSPLDDLAGYRILYGRTADDLDQSVLIPDPAAREFEFTTLATGVWYFMVVAVNANGLEGPPSTPAMKTI